ncbi:MAG: Cfr10I/Bse634I family restriction endonuclease [Campylobacterales bacterium]|nr:Cfr10I/Bse634I family restriction endonuclease [Campylobacterales bacterium]
MPFIEILPNGTPQIKPKDALAELLANAIPGMTQDLSTLFEGFDTTIRNLNTSIKEGALNKIHGDWYEWLLAIEFWNFRIRHNRNYLILNLPNVSQFDCSKLYNETLSGFIDNLKEKVYVASGVELISSNPDYVIIDTSNMILDVKFTELITEVTPEIINMLTTAYEDFIHQCDFEQLIGYVSVKTSLRPDRRLQLAHEGSLMKALYVHLQTREWIIEPIGLKYYAISRKVNSADRRALKTVATHSITTVQSKPQSAVDDVFEINSFQNIVDQMDSIIL